MPKTSAARGGAAPGRLRSREATTRPTVPSDNEAVPTHRSAWPMEADPRAMTAPIKHGRSKTRRIQPWPTGRQGCGRMCCVGTKGRTRVTSSLAAGYIRRPATGGIGSQTLSRRIRTALEHCEGSQRRSAATQMGEGVAVCVGYDRCEDRLRPVATQGDQAHWRPSQSSRPAQGSRWRVRAELHESQRRPLLKTACAMGRAATPS